MGLLPRASGGLSALETCGNFFGVGVVADINETIKIVCGQSRESVGAGNVYKFVRPLGECIPSLT